ncbi:MAG: Gfo/Idh/MocA family oxidoreductase [Opitutales bacterium]
MKRNTGFTRRQFLKGTAAALGAAATGPLIITSSALGANGRPSASNRITMGGIGLGGMGRGNLNGFLGRNDVQVVAVCDVDANHRRQAREMVEDRYSDEREAGAYRGCDEYNDFRDLLARKDIDTVMIATPDHWHCLIAVAAAKAGKDMYCEKPLALTIGQGRALSDTMTRYGRIFQAGSQQRSDSRFRHACELVRNGRIGKLKTVTCGLPTGPQTGPHEEMPIPDGFDYNMWLGPAPWAPYTRNRTHWDFRWILDYSGGQLTDWGAHHCDIAQWGMGTEHTGPTEIEGSGEYPENGLYTAATNYRYEARYADGVTMIVTNGFRNGVRFEGEEGWIFVSRGRIEAEPHAILSSVIGPNETRLYRSGNHRGNFIDCVKSRAQPIAPAEAAHRSIAIAHLGNIAMQLGRKVQWDPEAERFPGDPEANRMIDRPMRSPWAL